MKISIYITILLSFINANQISCTSGGNIENFSLMNSTSYIDNIIGHDDNVFSFSLIRYPAEVHLNQILYNRIFNQYTIQSKIILLNWGTLTEIGDDGKIDKFKASEKIIELSILNQISKKLILGSSIGYLTSNIDKDGSQHIIQNIGLRRTFLNNSLHIGLSLENMLHSIKTYSNVDEEYYTRTNIGISYYPKHIDGAFYINYLYENSNDGELIVALKNSINDNITLYTGKSFYMNRISSEYTIYDNFSFGIDIVRNQYKFNIATQYLGDIGLIFGSSIAISIK